MWNWRSRFGKALKLNLISDLHLEFGRGDLTPRRLNVDAYVIAGDFFDALLLASADEISQLPTHWPQQNLATGYSVDKVTEKQRQALAYLHQLCRFGQPVLFVPGNHEGYFANPNKAKQLWQTLADQYANLHLLDNAIFDLGKFRFIGSTLCSDLSAIDNPGQTYQGYNDFAAIKDWQPVDHHQTFNSNRAFLAQALTQAVKDKQTPIVVTHHAPSFAQLDKWDKNTHSYAAYQQWDPALGKHVMQAIPEPVRHGGKNALYASDLTGLIKQYQPPLWCHGHIHQSLDYHINATRVICNPRGYYPKHLNRSFVHELVVKVSAKKLRAGAEINSH